MIRPVLKYGSKVLIKVSSPVSVYDEDLQELYPVGTAGNFVIGGDDELEEQLGLPDEIRAVKLGDRVVQQYDPYQIKLPQLGGSIYNSFHTILS